MNPSMHNSHPRVVAVALNPALDHTLEVDQLRLGEVNRAVRMQVDVGGKGINVASCLADFGVATAVTGQIGRDNAAQFETLFHAKGIDNRFFYLDGLTRINTKLVDKRSGDTTDINMPGPTLEPEAIQALFDRLLARIDGMVSPGSWVVASGSLPPQWPADTYQRLITHVHSLGAHVLLDASGAALNAGVGAAPDIIKPNRAELSELIGQTLTDADSVVAAARELLARPNAPGTVVVSMGGDGALFVNRKEALLAHPIPTELISTVGAGDAMVAGIVAAQIAGLGLSDCARLATAFAAGKLARLGPHLPAPDTVRALAQMVHISSFS
ncbi:1-phosphofructokinase [Rhodoferax sp. U11-2br]|uniref:1-phosphofructokinase n=1 Tax=Rhodoferax sp. U11-2br TaxID=2838878 RepID=UPI0020371BEF|nr:1-phosphofructokinase [Rhodoferax sp. U11-2br]